MNAKTENQIKNMKAQTIGVEVEMYDITRDRAAEIAAEFFGTGRYRNTAIKNGYAAWSAWDNKGREWKFQKDVSIIASSDARKCELVTPILTYDDIEDLQGLLRELRHAGAKSNPSHMCGVHIHIGADGQTPQTLRNLANLMASHESLLISAMRISQNRIGRYCKMVNKNFLDKLNKAKPKTLQDLKDIWYEGNGATYGITQHYNTHNAIRKFMQGEEPLSCGGNDEHSNGNGSLMRIAPVPLYAFMLKVDKKEALNITHNISMLTHAHSRSLIACGIYTLIALNLLDKKPLSKAVKIGLQDAKRIYGENPTFKDELKFYESLWDIGAFVKLPEAEISSSGYVVDTLEAVIWCLGNTDTVGAIVGGLAGLAYGEDDIPTEWVNALLKKDFIEKCCEDFANIV